MRAWNHFHWIVFACVLITPVLVYTAIQSETNTQDVRTWLPNGTPERAEYDRFLSSFGHDDDILLSWPGCHVDDPRLAELTRRLDDQNRIDSYYRGIINGSTVLNELKNSRLGLSESARHRLKRSAIDSSLKNPL